MGDTWVLDIDHLRFVAAHRDVYPRLSRCSHLFCFLCRKNRGVDLVYTIYQYLSISVLIFKHLLIFINMK